MEEDASPPHPPPLVNRHVAVTGLSGGVGAHLAKQLLLLGAKVTLHHPDGKESVTEESVEACGGLLRESDLNDELPAAIGRRLRAWVLAEGARAGGGTGQAGRVEVLTPDPAESNAIVAAADAVVTCDGSGPLSVIAGLGEAARRRPGGKQVFALAQARGFVGTVFVDSGDPAVAQTLYQALRPTATTQKRNQNQNRQGGVGARGGANDDKNNELLMDERRRQEALHTEFLRSHPETRPLIPPKKATNDDDDNDADATTTDAALAELAGAAADAEGTAPAPFAALVSAFAAARLARLLGPPPAPEGNEEEEQQWFHLDALDLRRPKREVAAAAAMAALGDAPAGAGEGGGADSGGYKSVPDGGGSVGGGGVGYESIPGGGGGGDDDDGDVGGAGGGGGGGVDAVSAAMEGMFRDDDGDKEFFGGEGGEGDEGGDSKRRHRKRRGGGSRSAVQAPLLGVDVQRRLGGLQVLVMGGAGATGGAAILALAGAGVGAGRGGCLAVLEARRRGSGGGGGGDTRENLAEAAATHPLMCAANPGDLECLSPAAVCAAAAAECFPEGNIRALNLPAPPQAAERESAAAAAVAELFASFDVVVDGGGDEEDDRIGAAGAVDVETACRAARTTLIRPRSTTRVAAGDVAGAGGAGVAGAVAALEVIRIAMVRERGGG